MSEQEEVLSKNSHATIRIMFKQRYFTSTLPLLLQAWHACMASALDS
jgi:hypothetical protein